MITARSNGDLRKKKPFKVLVCIVTLVAFLFNTVSYNAAWAVGTPSELPGGGSEEAGGSGLFKELNPDTFALPEYLGYVKYSYKGNSPAKVVIHIQDAHCNYAAQHKISEIIEYLNNEYGIDTVNLEGGAKDYDLSIFTGIDDKTIREKTADYFVKEGLVNGAEYFAINNPEKSTLWGIEDTKLYIDNLNVYRDSLKYKEEVDNYLNSLTHILSNLKIKIYPPELLEFDGKYSRYKAGTLEFKDYLAYLIQSAKNKAIDIKGFTNIYLLSQALAEEGNIDFKKANNQRDDLIDKLQKKLSKKSLEELVVKTVEFRSDKIPQKDFYAYLVDKANLVGIELKDFPDLQKYVVYISMYSAIDKMKTVEEMNKLENAIKEAFYQNDKQRELDKLSKNLAILKNIFNISLTKEDYRYYIDNERSFNMSNYASFINKEAPLYKITAGLDKNITDIDHRREDISKFYEYSFKRDDIFLKSMKFATPSLRARPRSSSGREKQSKDVTILITGGFHTENLCEMFKKENIAYISIMPAFSNNNGYACPYFKLLSGTQNETMNGLLKEVSTLALFTDFCKESGVVNGEMTEKARALWVELVRWSFEGTETKVIGGRYYTFNEGSGLVKVATVEGKPVFARTATEEETELSLSQAPIAPAPGPVAPSARVNKAASTALKKPKKTATDKAYEETQAIAVKARSVIRSFMPKKDDIKTAEAFEKYLRDKLAQRNKPLEVVKYGFFGSYKRNLLAMARNFDYSDYGALPGLVFELVIHQYTPRTYKESDKHIVEVPARPMVAHHLIISAGAGLAFLALGSYVALGIACLFVASSFAELVVLALGGGNDANLRHELKHIYIDLVLSELRNRTGGEEPLIGDDFRSYLGEDDGLDNHWINKEDLTFAEFYRIENLIMQAILESERANALRGYTIWGSRRHAKKVWQERRQEEKEKDKARVPAATSTAPSVAPVAAAEIDRGPEQENMTKQDFTIWDRLKGKLPLFLMVLALSAGNSSAGAQQVAQPIAPSAISQPAPVRFDTASFVNDKTNRANVTRGEYEKFRKIVRELTDVSYEDFVKSQLTAKEKKPIVDAINLVMTVDANQAKGILDAIKHIVILDVDFPAMATSGGFIIMGRNHLKAITNDNIIKGWAYVYIHEGGHLEDEGNGLNILNPRDLAERAKGEELAYKRTLHLAEKLEDANTIAIQRFIYEHIKDNGYRGLIAGLVALRTSLEGNLLFLIFNADKILTNIHKNLLLEGTQIEYLGLYDATYGNKKCFNLEYMIGGKTYRVFIAPLQEEPGAIRINLLTQPEEIKTKDSIYRSLDISQSYSEGEENGIVIKTSTSSQALSNVNSLFIIGMTHLNEIDDLFQEKLVRAASGNGIVLGIEGLERRDIKERDFVKNVYGLDEKGLVFGFEDDFANGYSGILLHYGYVVNGMVRAARSAKSQLIHDIKISDAIRRNWERLKNKKIPDSSKQLYDQITNYIESNKGADLKTLVTDFYRKANDFGDAAAWAGLFKELAYEMTEEAKKMPEGIMLSFDKVTKYLENPRDSDNQNYVVNELNGRWRDEFIFKNMKEIAAVASVKGLNVYFLIGEGHVQGISRMFDSIHSGLIKRVYQRSKFVPEEFVPSSPRTPTTPFDTFTLKPVSSVPGGSKISDFGIAGDNQGGINRREHEDYHRQGIFEEVISDIAHQISANKRPDGRFDLRLAAERSPGKRIKTSNGELYITGDGVLVIVDSRFRKNHAGRGEFAVYAATDAKAEHEITELRLWARFAVEKGIVTQDDITAGLLGKKLREWMSDAGISKEERSGRQEMIIGKVDEFHQRGLEAEGLAIANLFQWPAQFDISDTSADEKQLLSLIFAMLPKNIRLLLLARIKKIIYPSASSIGDGSSLNGDIELGHCLDPLYFVELMMHEIGHTFDPDLRKYLGVEKATLKTEVDLNLHMRTHGLLLYLVYPERLHELARKDEVWNRVYEFYKSLFNGKEYSSEELQPLFALIESIRHRRMTEYRSEPFLLKIAAKQRKGYLYHTLDGWNPEDEAVRREGIADNEREEEFDFIISSGREDFKADDANNVQMSARALIDRILLIGNDHNRWEERYELKRQLAALGKAAVPSLIEILRTGKNDDEKTVALDALEKTGDERAMDVLADILSDNPDLIGWGSTAAYGLGLIGKTASPRVKTLLSAHGPKRNILLAVEELEDESFVPILKDLKPDDNDTKRFVGKALMALGDKSGLATLVDLAESSIKEYEETKDEPALIFAGVVLDDLSVYSVRDKIKAMLRTDPPLEGRLVAAVRTMIDLIEKNPFAVQTLIGLFGLGTSDTAAKNLWELYMKFGGDKAFGRTIAFTMKEVGPACVPYLTGGRVVNDLIYEILGNIGDASATPFLLREYEKAVNSKRGYYQMQAISKTIEKIGEKALPHLLEALENEKEDNSHICLLLARLNSPKAVPRMIGLLENSGSEDNKLNIIETLRNMELIDSHVKTVLKQDPLLRKTLFDSASASLKDGLDSTRDLAIGSMLKIAATDEDSRKLIDIYRKNGIEVRKAVLNALSERGDDATIAFLIGLLPSDNEEIAQASLETMNSLSESGKLAEYLKRNGDKREELTAILETRLQTSASAMSILGSIGSKRCLDILIKELDRRVRQDIVINAELLKALMVIGDKAKAALLSGHPDLLEAVDRMITEYLLAPYAFNTPEESAKNVMAWTFKNWLAFIGPQKAVKRPVTRRELAEVYFSQREDITNLITKLKGRLAEYPDMGYGEIMKFAEKDIRGMGARARIRFRMGVIRYIRDRERVREVFNEAEKIGIKDGEILAAADIRNNDAKRSFVVGILGFLPAQTQIFFMADTIHIILNPEAYGRMRYRQKNNVTGPEDGYSQLLLPERFHYQDSTGLFSFYQGGKIGGVELSGLLTAEIMRSDTNGRRTQEHERQHKFFHGYAADELREARLLAITETNRLTEEINGESGDEQRRSVKKLIEAGTKIILYCYQDEMMARIIAGNWMETRDISNWFEYYKEGYVDDAKEIVNKINDEGLRQDIIDGIFGAAKEILTKHKPAIDRIIELKARLIERDEKIDHESALKKANEWVATFFQTIPLIRFDRLDWLVSRLNSELEIESTAKTTSNLDKGTLKDIGINGESETAKVDNLTLMRWKEIAAGKNVETKVIKGMPVSAKFIVSDPFGLGIMPKGISSHYFYDEQGNLVIVGAYYLQEEEPDEAIYHESREAHWAAVLYEEARQQDAALTEELLNAIRRDAHMLAAAEESIAFGEPVLTPFHKRQVASMSQGLLEQLVQENRQAHHELIQARLSAEDYDKYLSYEQRFIKKLEQKLSMPDKKTQMRELKQLGEALQREFGVKLGDIYFYEDKVSQKHGSLLESDYPEVKALIERTIVNLRQSQPVWRQIVRGQILIIAKQLGKRKSIGGKADLDEGTFTLVLDSHAYEETPEGRVSLDKGIAVPDGTQYSHEQWILFHEIAHLGDPYRDQAGSTLFDEKGIDKFFQSDEYRTILKKNKELEVDLKENGLFPELPLYFVGPADFLGKLRRIIYEIYKNKLYEAILATKSRSVTAKDMQAYMITPYAGTSVLDFWAESFTAFFLCPNLLQQKDPIMFSLFSMVINPFEAPGLSVQAAPVEGLEKYSNEQRALKGFVAIMNSPENMVQRKLIIEAVNSNNGTNAKKIRERLRLPEEINKKTYTLDSKIMEDYLGLCRSENFDNIMKKIVPHAELGRYGAAISDLRQKTIDFQNTLAEMGLKVKEGAAQERIAPAPVSPDDAILAALIAETILNVPPHPLAPGGEHVDLASSGQFRNGYQLKFSPDRKLVEGTTPYGYFWMSLPDGISAQYVDNRLIARIVTSRAIIRKIVSEWAKQPPDKRRLVKQRISRALSLPIMSPEFLPDNEPDSLKSLREALEQMKKLKEKGQMKEFINNQTLQEEFKSVLACILQPSQDAGKDSPVIRNKATTDALRSEEDPASRNPIAVIGLPMWIAGELRQKNINPDAYLAALEKEISRMLGKKGYGDPANVHRLKVFFMEKDANTTKDNLQKVLYTIKTDQEIVIFMPRTKIKGTVIEIDEASLDLEKLGNQYTIIPDAYNDIDTSNAKGFPDINARMTITRLVAWYKAAKSSITQKAALEDLTTYLGAIGAISGEQIKSISDSGNLNDLLKRIGLLKIRPVDYKDITDWRDNYKAIATAL